MTEAPDVVTVGSLDSVARGEGARKSAGKPQWFQIPWWTVVDYLDWLPRVLRPAEFILLSIHADMASWQRGVDEYLDTAIVSAWELTAGDTPGRDFAVALSTRDLLPLARVLEFGARKYPSCAPELAFDKDGRPTPAASGNWTKGMAWSVCFSSAMSHLTKRAAGDLLDEESGESHAAHALCNLLFLKAYQDLFPEGDDRLVGFRPGGVEASRNDHD